MLKIIYIKTSVAESREFDNMKADIERNKAHNDYIAMMCDINLSEQSEEFEEVIPHEE